MNNDNPHSSDSGLRFSEVTREQWDRYERLCKELRYQYTARFGASEYGWLPETWKAYRAETQKITDEIRAEGVPVDGGR